MTITNRLSPNVSRDAHGAPIARKLVNAIVLHDTGGKTAEGALSWFASPASGVSAHYVIGKDGAVYRCVPDDLIAWHAGTSVLWGEEHVNRWSLGIELVDDHDGDLYPEPQVGALIDLTTDLCWRYRIPLNRVVGHEHIAVPRGRKVDPGDDMPWFVLLAAVGRRLAERLR